jgi:hypothetical protein
MRSEYHLSSHAFPPHHSPSLTSPSLPITSTYRSPRRQLVLGRLLGGGVIGEDHVGIQGAFGLDQVHGGCGALGHGGRLGVVGVVAWGVATERCEVVVCVGG